MCIVTGCLTHTHTVHGQRNGYLIEFIGNFSTKRRLFSDWRASRSERFTSEQTDSYNPK